MSQHLRKTLLYDEDFYTWTNEQAALLRAGRFEHVDIPNIIEEIETLGRSEASSLRSSMRLIIMHLLKMIHQPERATNSWRAMVVRERDKMGQTLLDNPGLKPRLTELFDQAYQVARRSPRRALGRIVSRSSRSSRSIRSRTRGSCLGDPRLASQGCHRP